MTAILVSYHGAPVALAGPRDTHLVGQLASARDGDPHARFALYMVYYAQQVARGQLSGPYTDTDAQRFARAALIHRGYLACHLDRAPVWLAERLGVPEDQIQLAMSELRESEDPGKR